MVTAEKRAHLVHFYRAATRELADYHLHVVQRFACVLHIYN